mgnify:CR=1 FL=1
MQPLISEENVNELIDLILSDLPKWRKDMIHYIKTENPELNSAIIEISQKSNLDPKALATGAYMTYRLLENEQENNSDDLNDIQ